MFVHVKRFKKVLDYKPSMPETEQERDMYREDDKIVVETNHRQLFTEDEYQDVVDNVKQQISEREEKLEQIRSSIEQILESDDGELKIIHSIVDEEEQEMDTIESNSVGPSAVNKYVQLRNMNDQQDKLVEEIRDLKEDLEELMNAEDL